MAKLGANRYGKASVRLMKVVRHADYHAMKEWSVRVLLSGEFESCFTEGDNGAILPTDTMKNTVYSIARESRAETLEAFALELAEYLAENNAQVDTVSVEVDEKSWERAEIDGAEHATTYRMGGPELQTVVVSLERGGTSVVTAGIDGLMILKTTHSEFTGYIKDKLTTLPESTDRIFGTRATVSWKYSEAPGDYAASRAAAVDTLIGVFAGHHSLSVQHTLYAMGEAVLAAVPEISSIKLTMPNLHCLLVDLSRFRQDNPNQIYVPINEPYGYIEAEITR